MPFGSGGATFSGAGLFETFLSAPTSVNSGTFTALPWTKVGGASLFDLSIPVQPTPLVAGIYEFSIWVKCTSGVQAAGTSLLTDLELWTDGDDYAIACTTPLDMAPNPGAAPQSSLSLAHYIPAAAHNALSIQHDVGAARNFTLGAYVQRLA